MNSWLLIGRVLPLVQWTEQIAFWLRPVEDAMWRQMLAGGYLQVDETPVRVLDPDAEGKAVLNLPPGSAIEDRAMQGTAEYEEIGQHNPRADGEKSIEVYRAEGPPISDTASCRKS